MSDEPNLRQPTNSAREYEANSTENRAAACLLARGSSQAPLAHEAVQLALGHRANIDVESDNDEVIDNIQSQIMPGDDTLVAWIRDPTFATVLDPIGSARNGAEMLTQAADWLTWSVSRDAVEAVRPMLMSPPAADD